MNIPSRLILGILSAIALFAPKTAFSVPWSFDREWNGSGRSVQPLIVPEGDATLQPDGKVLVAGYALRNRVGPAVFAVSRFLADGTLDETWGEKGIVYTGFGAGRCEADVVRVCPDGKVVVGGGVYDVPNAPIGIARFTTDGQLDPTFNGNGLVTFALDGQTSTVCQRLAVQADGKIVVIANRTKPDQKDFAVIRFTADGQLDPEWGAGTGIVTTDFEGMPDSVADVAVQFDGKVVVLGSSTALAPPRNRLASIARYLSDGSLDPAFHGTGKRTFAGPLFANKATSFDAHALALQSDGKILLGGNGHPGSSFTSPSTRRFLLARLHADGVQDETFNGTGWGATLSTAAEGIEALALHDGKILAAGLTYEEPQMTSRISVVRYRSDGSLDETFDQQGLMTRIWAAYASPVMVQSDGRILLRSAAPYFGYSASAMSVIRLREGIETEPPQLCAPAHNSFVQKSSSSGFLEVWFALTRTAMSGSVRLRFDDGVVSRTLVLNRSFELAGFHLLRFSYANPAQSAGPVLSGPPIPEGTYTVTVTYEDLAGNVASASSRNVIVDLQPPRVHPDDLHERVVEATSPAGAVVTFTLRGLDNYDPAPYVRSTNLASGQVFPIGTTRVYVLCRDAATNYGSGSFNVTVRDSTAPQIEAPPGGFSPLKFMVPKGDTVALPDYLAQATITDAVGVVSVQQVPPPGSAVGEGTTTVTFTASDAAGNTSEQQFDVIVEPEPFEWSLDPAWGGTGQVRTTPVLSRDGTVCVAVQSDGKVLLATDALRNQSRNLIVVRHEADGSVDPTWGENGIVFLGEPIFPKAMALQPDGKLIVMGTYDASRDQLALVRFDASGQIDHEGFNKTGIALWQVAPDRGSTLPQTMALQADGKIVVAASCPIGNGRGFGVARFTVHGFLDPTWGYGTGFVTADFTVGSDTPVGITVRSDGKVVVVGDTEAGSLAAVARYLPNGDPDTSLNGPGSIPTGKLLTPTATVGRIRTAAFQPDGKIIIAGDTRSPNNGNFALERLTADGDRDSTFVTTSFGLDGVPRLSAATAMAIQPDGRIVAIAGESGSWTLVRFEKNGGGKFGYQRQGFSGDGYGEIRSLALQRDGKILVPGMTRTGPDSGLSAWRVREVAATDPPQLYTPAPGSMNPDKKGLMSVDYVLPERPAAGSVSLAFDDGNTVRSLSLAARWHRAGDGKFRFAVRNPVNTSDGAIISGEPIPDGVYTVSLTYRDLAGNPPATTSAYPVTIDTTPPVVLQSTIVVEATSAAGARVTFDPLMSDHLDPAPKVTTVPESGADFPIGETIVSVRATDGAGNIGTGTFTVTVVDTTPPTIAEPAGGFAPRVLPVPQGGRATLPDYLAQATMSDAVGVAGVEQWPAPGTRVGEGMITVTFTAYDAAGNATQKQLQILVQVSGAAVLATSGVLVPRGGSDPWIPPGAVWGTFGVPSITAGGANAGWLATVRIPAHRRIPARQFRGIFSGPLGAPVLRLKTGEPMREIGGATFESFREPVFAGDDFAVAATLRGGSDAKDAGLWAMVSGRLHRIVREGTIAAGTRAKFKAFTSVAMPTPGVVFFVAKLSASSGGDMGLWVWTEADGARLCLREGQPIEVGGPALKSFVALSDVKGSPGHGRYDAERRAIDVLLHFKSTQFLGSSAIAHVEADGTVKVTASLGDLIGGVSLIRVGVPSSPGGHLPNVTSLARTNRHDQNWDGVLDYGAEIFIGVPNTRLPGEETQFITNFLDPVAGTDANGEVVHAGLAHLAGPLFERRMGVWAATSAGLELIARTGDDATDRDGESGSGASWEEFTSLSILAGRGPLFTATLARNAKKSPRTLDTGLWATGSDGRLRLMLRTGEVIDGKTLRSFDVLEAVAGSPGQRRAWTSGDASARVIYRAFFTDGSSAIVSTAVP